VLHLKLEPKGYKSMRLAIRRPVNSVPVRYSGAIGNVLYRLPDGRRDLTACALKPMLARNQIAQPFIGDGCFGGNMLKCKFPDCRPVAWLVETRCIDPKRGVFHSDVQHWLNLLRQRRDSASGASTQIKDRQGSWCWEHCRIGQRHFNCVRHCCKTDAWGVTSPFPVGVRPRERSRRCRGPRSGS